MKLKYASLLFIFLLISCQGNKPSLEIEVYTVDNGYGYLIKHGLKIVIKQEFIPAIQGKQAFCSKEDAQKTANLVIKKIENKQNPMVTIAELEHLNINFNCLDLLE